MRRAVVAWTALCTLACAGGAEPAGQLDPAAQQPPAPPAIDTDGALASATRRVEVSDWVDGADYAQRWLIILSSKEELGHRPESLAPIAEHPELDLGVVRLSSSQFKGLMPCYEVVVAAALDERAEAVALSKRLTALGIDNYPKNAGAYVGEQPHVEAYCQDRRVSAGDSCERFHFVERWGERTFLDLALGEAAADRLDLDATPARITREAWVAPLALERIEDVAVGDAFDLHAWGVPEVQARCTVSSLVALTRGTPHFGMQELDSPACGEAEVFAELSCDDGGGEVGYAVPSGSGALGMGQASQASEAAVGAAVHALQGTAAYAALRAEALDESEGDTLREEHEVAVFSGPTGDWITATAWLHTGEGFDACGGGDVNRHVTAAMALAPGGVVGPVRWARDTSWTELMALGDLDGDGRPEVLESSFPTTLTLRSGGGAESCASRMDYCDCPC